jgi:hypothetical protein
MRRIIPFTPPAGLADAVNSAKARVSVGYPWWLRPWLAHDVIAITLGRRIYLSAKTAAMKEASLERLLRHELAHVRQVERLGLIIFLWRYVTEFIGHLRKERSFQRAYSLISFEIEAVEAEQGL